MDDLAGEPANAANKELDSLEKKLRWALCSHGLRSSEHRALPLLKSSRIAPSLTPVGTGLSRLVEDDVCEN